MSEIIKISNEFLTVEISTFGAEIVSVKSGEFENMWCGDPEVWADHAPILFPICGNLKDNKYIYENKEYFLKSHGFAKMSEFVLEEADDMSATFLLKANDEILKLYPFNFEFRAKYTLDSKKLHVEYETRNTDEKTMYFSVGSHEGYSCPEGIEEYSLVFDEPEDLENNLLDLPLLNYDHATFGIRQELPLKYEYFDIDTLVFKKLKTRNVTLKNRNTGRQISVSFEGFDYLMIWTMDKAKFLCIEPWAGLPDYIDSDYDITKKPGIMELVPGNTIKKSHVITF